MVEEDIGEAREPVGDAADDDVAVGPVDGNPGGAAGRALDAAPAAAHERAAVEAGLAPAAATRRNTSASRSSEGGVDEAGCGGHRRRRAAAITGGRVSWIPQDWN